MRNRAFFFSLRYHGRMERFFDAHAHAQFPAYAGEHDDVVRRAQDAGVDLILVGTEKGTSADAIALAERFDGVWAAVGLHPTHVSPRDFVDPQEIADAGDGHDAESFDYDAYRAMAEHPKVVAIGECGLDYFRLDPGTARVQQEALVAQLQLAADVRKPVTIHCRDAFADLIALFRDNRRLLGDEPGTIHFFTGTEADARDLMDLGFSLQFGGVITFAKEYEDLVRFVPLDRIVTETDAPYVAPVPYRGKRNEPAYVVEVARKVAELRGIGVEEVRDQVRRNARRIFGI